MDRAALTLTETLYLVTDQCLWVWTRNGGPVLSCFSAFCVLRFVWFVVWVLPTSAWADGSLGLFLFYIWIPAPPKGGHTAVAKIKCLGLEISQYVSNWCRDGIIYCRIQYPWNSSRLKDAVSFVYLGVFPLQVNFIRQWTELRDTIGNEKKRKDLCESTIFSLKHKEMGKYICGGLG